MVHHPMDKVLVSTHWRLSTKEKTIVTNGKQKILFKIIFFGKTSNMI